MAICAPPDYFIISGRPERVWASRRGKPKTGQTVAWAHVGPGVRELYMLGQVADWDGADLVVVAHGSTFRVPGKVARLAYRPDAFQYARAVMMQYSDHIVAREQAMLALMSEFGLFALQALGVVNAVRRRGG